MSHALAPRAVWGYHAVRSSHHLSVVVVVEGYCTISGVFCLIVIASPALRALRACVRAHQSVGST